MNNSRFFTVPGSARKYDRNWMLAVLLISLALTLLQVSSVNNLLPSIEGAMSASESGIQLVLSGYALAVGVTLVPAGRLGDIFGRSSMWVIGLVVFTLASLGSGLAVTITGLNAMRVVQGIGAGIFSPQVTGLIQQYFEGRARAKAFGYMGLVVAASVAVGPLLSGSMVGLLGQDPGWRYSFFVNVPLGLFGLLAAWKFLPFGKERRTIGKGSEEAQREYDARRGRTSRTDESHDRSGALNQHGHTNQPGHVNRPGHVNHPGQAPQSNNTKRSRRARKKQRIDLDPVGMLLLTAAVLGIMLPFILHGVWWRWLLLAAGFILLGIWVAWESWYGRQGHFPMVKMELFQLRSFSYNTAIGALMFLGSPSTFVVIALFLQDGLSVSALTVGILGFPNAVASGFAAVWAGRHAYEQGKGLQVFALSLMLGSLVFLAAGFWAAINLGWSVYWLMIPLTPMGFGAGTMGAANQTQTMLDVPAANGGTAGGVQQMTQRITTAIGNALVTGVVFSVYAGGRTTEGWLWGASAGLGVIALFLAAALTVAVIFWKRPSPSLAK